MYKTITMLAVCLIYSAAGAAETGLAIHSTATSTASVERKSLLSYSQNKNAGVSVQRKQVVRDKKRISSLTGQSIGKPANPVQYRDLQPLMASNAGWFEIYDAQSWLNVDYDGDGYYSDFTIEFDADSAGGFADVYAKLYLSAAGGAWVLYHTTDVFTIYAGDDGDDYSVQTRLRFDFPTGNYDVLIDLYEAGYPGIVATIGPEDADLYALPLEDREHELGNDDTLISDVTTYLQGDYDHDGFYTGLSIDYAIDTITPGIEVYAEIVLTHTAELWQYTFTTENFMLHNQTEQIDIALDSGFDPAWYDAEITLIDAYSGQVLAVAAQDFSALTGMPLESDAYDDLKDYPDNDQPYFDGTDSVSSRESGGGGALSFLSMFMGFCLLIAKRMTQMLTMSRQD